jgi:DNA polymerase elongation subunit (family B)
MSDYLKKILFVDIETVSQYAAYDDMPKEKKDLWISQCKQSYLDRNWIDPNGPLTTTDIETLYRNRAAIHAEFGKIICAGVGFLSFADDGEPTLRVKTITEGAGEGVLLTAFATIAEKFPVFCAHNGKKFDFPYLARRMLINGMKVLPSLDTRDKKPWEIEHIDTQEMWRFGDMAYPSLELLASVLGIPFKKELEGNEIGDVYRRGDVKRIADYCAGDVVALARTFVKLKNPALNIKNVQIV